MNVQIFLVKFIKKLLRHYNNGICGSYTTTLMLYISSKKSLKTYIIAPFGLIRTKFDYDYDYDHCISC